MAIRFDIKTDLNSIYSSGGSLPHVGLGDLLSQLISGEVNGPGVSTQYSISTWGDAVGTDLLSNPNATISPSGILSLSAANITHSLTAAIRIGDTLQAANVSGSGALRYNAGTLQLSDGVTWANVNSNNAEWHIAGNAGTSPGVDFIGTIDNQDFIIKTNSLPRITVSALGAVSVASDLIVSGDLTVNGTLTYINTVNVEVTDKNIVVNKGGNDIAAEGAGITVDRVSTQGSVAFDSSLVSNWKAGLLGAEYEVLTVANSTSNLQEGTNLYYTQGRFDTAFSNKSTTDLVEGTNLYYTQGRFDAAFGNKSTTDLVEGTNLYYTTARVNIDAANRNLSNLLSPTAINQSLLFSSDGSSDIGASTDNRPNNIYALSRIDSAGTVTIGNATTGVNSGKNLLWNTDGGGNIGTPHSSLGYGLNRPENIYAKANIYSRRMTVSFIASQASNTLYPISFVRGRGTEGAATQLLANDYLGRLNWYSTTGVTVTSTVLTATIEAQILENATAATAGSRIIFKTAALGTNALLETVSVATSGVTFGTGILFSAETFDIGAIATNRPNNVYIKSNLEAGGNVAIGGGLKISRNATATNIALTSSDCYMGVDSTNPVTITLPLANTVKNGQVYYIKDETGNASVNSVTIQASGANTVDGSASYSLSVSYESITVIGDGASNWFIV